MLTLQIMVLNSILSIFNLEITDKILYYTHKLNAGEFTFKVIDLNTVENQHKLTDFLELTYLPTTNDVDDIYYAIVNSKYFTKKSFIHLNYPYDSYRQFLNTLKQRKPVNIYRPTYIPEFTTTIIDRTFNTTITSSIRDFRSKGMSQNTEKNKFNNHLVQKWVKELHPGRYLIEIVKHFKNFIEAEFKVNFIEYILERPSSLIRKDFIEYYYVELEYFDKLFLEEEIPI